MTSTKIREMGLGIFVLVSSINDIIYIKKERRKEDGKSSNLKIQKEGQ